MKVLFLAAYPAGLNPGQRFRFEQWTRLLPDRAIQSTLLPLFDERTYERMYDRGHFGWKAVTTSGAFIKRVRHVVSASNADVVVLFREAFPLGPPLLELMLERRVPVVYDFDDAIFLGDTSRANAVVAHLKMPQKTGRIISDAAATTVGNEFLAEYARDFSHRVHVIPTTIDIEEYQPQHRVRSGEAVRIGWSGSRTTSAHLHTVDRALTEVLARYPATLTAIGDQTYKLTDASRQVEARPWRREIEVEDLSTFDIGIMPLPNDDWARGKCGLKALQYMALGIPTVASPVGVNTEIIEHGANGFIAETNEEWVDALGRLIEDEALRKQLGEAGRETVVDRYSGQRWAPRFLEILQEAVSRSTS